MHTMTQKHTQRTNTMTQTYKMAHNDANNDAHNNKQKTNKITHIVTHRLHEHTKDSHYYTRKTKYKNTAKGLYKQSFYRHMDAKKVFGKNDLCKPKYQQAFIYIQSCNKINRISKTIRRLVIFFLTLS